MQGLELASWQTLEYVISGVGQRRIRKLDPALGNGDGKVKVPADWVSGAASSPKEIWNGTWECLTEG